MRHSFKRVISILLAAVLLAACMPAAFALSDTVPAGYTAIYTPEDLDGIRDDLAGNYILMNDIDMSEWGDWEPIGDEDIFIDVGVFRGVLDGNGYEIQNIKIGSTWISDGFYAAALILMNDGEIRNLGIVGAEIDGSQLDDAVMNGGILAFLASGVVENCYFQGSITSPVDYVSYNGGIVAYSFVAQEKQCVLRNCYSLVTFHDSEQSISGGIFGMVGFLTLENCYSQLEPIGWNEEDSAISTNVSALTESQMKQQASFTGFDFTTPVWYIQEGKSYPKLRPFPPEPESPTHFPDKETGITIDAPEGTFEPGTEMQVNEVGTGNFTLGPGNSVHAAYNISFVKDSKMVQPNGSVIVRLPFTGVSPSASANWKVYHVILDESGKVTDKINMNAKVVEVDGKWYWEFEASHFSIYAVAEEQGPAKPIMKGDKNVTLEYLGTGELAPLVDGDDLKWSGGNDYISVDEDTGTVTSNKGFVKTGSATITATNSEGKVEFSVKVKPTFGQWMMIIFLFGWIWM